MNRLILEPWEVGSDSIALVNGGRAKHLLEICRLTVGDTVRLGVVNSTTGHGRILAVDGQKLRLEVELDGAEKRESSKVTVLLALPRPQMLRRILQKAATFGVSKLVLFRSERVEKSYFSSPLLSEESIRAELLVGLQQGGDTVLPVVEIYKKFNEFLASDSFGSEDSRYLFDRDSAETLMAYQQPLKSKNSDPTFLIGPEGGFIPSEKELFSEKGFKSVKLSEHILRVESAFDFALAQHSLLSLPSEVS